MGYCHGGVVLFSQFLFDLFYRHYLAPFALDDVHVELLSLRNVQESVSEKSMRNDENVVALFCIVGDCHFHSKASCTCYDESLTFAVHQDFEVFYNFLVVPDEFRIAESACVSAHLILNASHSRRRSRYHDNFSVNHSFPPLKNLLY